MRTKAVESLSSASKVLAEVKVWVWPPLFSLDCFLMSTYMDTIYSDRDSGMVGCFSLQAAM